MDVPDAAPDPPDGHAHPPTPSSHPFFNFRPPLRIAIAGPPRKGKTTVARAILHHAGVPSHHLTQPPIPRASPVAGSRPNPFVSHILPVLRAVTSPLRFIASIVNPTQLGASVVVADLPGDGGQVVVLDSKTGVLHAGLSVVKAGAEDADVVLMVVRLDETGCANGDLVALRELAYCLDDTVLSRLIVVMSHASATPPMGLSTREFAKARVERFCRSLDIAFGPVAVDEEGRKVEMPTAVRVDMPCVDRHGEQEEQEGESGAGVGEDAEVDAGRLLGPRPSRERQWEMYEDFIRCLYGQTEPNKMKRGELTNEEAGKVTLETARVVYDLVVPREQRRRFRDVERPPMVAVELGGSLCKGVDELVEVIATRAQATRMQRQVEQENVEDGGERGTTPVRWAALRDGCRRAGQMVEGVRGWVGQSGLRIMGAEMAVVSVMLYVWIQWLKKNVDAEHEEDGNETDEERDTLLDMGDEAFAEKQRRMNGWTTVYDGTDAEVKKKVGELDDAFFQRARERGDLTDIEPGGKEGGELGVGNE